MPQVLGDDALPVATSQDNRAIIDRSSTESPQKMRQSSDPRRKPKKEAEKLVQADHEGAHAKSNSDKSTRNFKTFDPLMGHKLTLKNGETAVIQKPIGKGIHKTVYALGNDKAIAILTKEHNSKDAYQILKHEKEMLDRLPSEIHRVQVHEIAFIGDKPGMVMQKIDGISTKSKASEISNYLGANRPKAIENILDIKQKLIKHKIDVQDVQFLVTKEGDVYLNDPLNVILNSEKQKYLNAEIDTLINGIRIGSQTTTNYHNTSMPAGKFKPIKANTSLPNDPDFNFPDQFSLDERLKHLKRDGSDSLLLRSIPVNLREAQPPSESLDLSTSLMDPSNPNGGHDLSSIAIERGSYQQGLTTKDKKIDEPDSKINAARAIVTEDQDPLLATKATNTPELTVLSNITFDSINKGDGHRLADFAFENEQYQQGLPKDKKKGKTNIEDKAVETSRTPLASDRMRNRPLPPTPDEPTKSKNPLQFFKKAFTRSKPPAELNPKDQATSTSGNSAFKQNPANPVSEAKLTHGRVDRSKKTKEIKQASGNPKLKLEKHRDPRSPLPPIPEVSEPTPKRKPHEKDSKTYRVQSSKKLNELSATTSGERAPSRLNPIVPKVGIPQRKTRRPASNVNFHMTVDTPYSSKDRRPPTRAYWQNAGYFQRTTPTLYFLPVAPSDSGLAINTRVLDYPFGGSSFFTTNQDSQPSQSRLQSDEREHTLAYKEPGAGNELTTTPPGASAFDSRKVNRDRDLRNKEIYNNAPEVFVDPVGLIGKGTYKSVFKTTDGNVVALSHDKRPESVNIHALLGEAAMLNKLKDYGLPVVQNFGLVKFENRPGLAMEYIEGGISSTDLEKFTARAENYKVKVIEQLIFIRNTLKENDLVVKDLQFLIDSEGNLFLNDPLEVKELNSFNEYLSQIPGYNVDGYIDLIIGKLTSLEKPKTPSLSSSDESDTKLDTPVYAPPPPKIITNDNNTAAEDFVPIPMSQGARPKEYPTIISKDLDSDSGDLNFDNNEGVSVSTNSKSLAELLVTGKGGDTKALAFELNKLPNNVLTKLRDNKTRFYAVKDSVTDYFSGYKGVRPNGWPEGSTWDTVPGMYEKKFNIVTIATSGKYQDIHGSYNLTLHETGHAYDFAENQESQNSSTFFEAWESDRATLNNYQSQGDGKGQYEAYAESFGRYYGGDLDMGQKTPGMFEFWYNKQFDAEESNSVNLATTSTSDVITFTLPDLDLSTKDKYSLRIAQNKDETYGIPSSEEGSHGLQWSGVAHESR